MGLVAGGHRARGAFGRATVEVAAARAVVLAAGIVSGIVWGIAPAAAQLVQPQSPEPQIPIIPYGQPAPGGSFLLPPNAPPSPVLGYPTFNPFRPPVRNEPIGPWQVQPRIEGRETFDSNPTGAPRGGERPDGYSSLLPGVNITRQSATNTFVFDYQAEGRKYYTDTSLDQIRNNLTELSTTQLSEELLYLDTRAFIGQALINQRNAVSAIPQLQSANETEYYDYLISPYMRNHLGSFADTELRYSYAQTIFKNTSGGQLPDSLSNQISGKIDSGADYTRLIWSGNGLYSNTDRSGLSPNFLAPQFSGRNLNAPATRGTVSLGAEYAVTHEFSVLGTGGYESIHDPTLVHNIDDPTWSTGARFRPGPSTTLLLTYGFSQGEHYWSGSGTYDYDPATRAVARYSEGLVTNDSLLQSNLDALGVDEFGNFIDPVTRRQFDPTYSLFSLTTVSFRQKRFDGTFHAARQVNYYDLLIYHDDRTAQVTLTSDSSYGAVASWGRDLNPLTNGFMEFRYQHVKFQPDQRVDKNYAFTLGLRYSLSSSTDTYANYSYLVRDSQPSTNSLDDHVVFVGIRKIF